VLKYVESSKGGTKKKPGGGRFTENSLLNSLLDILFFMIWTLFDFCFLRFDYLPPRLPAHTSQKSTPPLQGVEICAATNFEIQIKIELRNFEI
jgi:hypothetical protein